MTTDLSDLDWDLEATRIVSDLVLAMATMQSVPDDEIPALWDAANGIAAATDAGLKWRAVDASRDPEAARQLKRLFCSQSLALDAVVEAMRQRSRGWDDLSVIEADIDKHMRSAGESLTYLRGRLPVP